MNYRFTTDHSAATFITWQICDCVALYRLNIEERCCLISGVPALARDAFRSNTSSSEAVAAPGAPPHTPSSVQAVFAVHASRSRWPIAESSATHRVKNMEMAAMTGDRPAITNTSVYEPVRSNMVPATGLPTVN